MKALGTQKNSRLNFYKQKKKDEVLQFLNVGVELLKCINQDLLEKRIFCIDKLIRRVVSHVKEKHSFALKRLSFAVKNSRRPCHPNCENSLQNGNDLEM